MLISVFGCLLCFGSAWFGVKGSAVSVLCLFLFLCACFRFYSYKLFMTVLGLSLMPVFCLFSSEVALGFRYFVLPARFVRFA